MILLDDVEMANIIFLTIQQHKAGENKIVTDLIKISLKKVQEKDGKLRILLQETLGNMMMIRSFVAEQQAFQEIANKTKEHNEKIYYC